MSFVDEIVGAAIGVAENKLDGKPEEEKTTFGGATLRFVITIIWILIAFVITFSAAILMVGGDFASILGLEGSTTLYALGIGACVVFALVTFLVPYLRKKGSSTRWCGIVAIGDALWWTYLALTL